MNVIGWLTRRNRRLSPVPSRTRLQNTAGAAIERNQQLIAELEALEAEFHKEPDGPRGFPATYKRNHADR